MKSTEQYDNAVARHYSAFRPPLHQLLLDHIVRPNECFQVGLDVGCGTGYSTIALTRYCDRVFGLDSSRSMLEQAQRHPKVTYIYSSGEDLSHIPMQTVDVVTFAGSLFYTKTSRLRNELLRVCRPGGAVLVYDFEVLLDDVMADVGVNCPAVASNYNHAVNLSDWAEFATEADGSKRVRLVASAEELTHVLLADSNRYDAFVTRFRNRDPFGSIVEYFKQRSTEVQILAEIYFARYRLMRTEEHACQR